MVRSVFSSAFLKKFDASKRTGNASFRGARAKCAPDRPEQPKSSPPSYAAVWATIEQPRLPNENDRLLSEFEERSSRGILQA